MPAPLEVQAKGVVDSMAGFVTQDAHALDVGAAFDLQHLLSFQPHQPRMCQIKRNCKSRHTVRRKPFRRQPDVRLKANAAFVQLAVETFNMRFKKRSLDSYRQIANTRVEQSLIRNETPSESGRHSANCSCDWFARLETLLADAG